MSSISTSYKTKRSTQRIDNLSFDETYDISAVELLAEDNSNAVIRRLQSDASGNLKVNISASYLSPTTGTASTVAGSASSVTLLASNANRLGATIFNDSTAALYIKLGATASATSFAIKVLQDDYYEVPFQYTGIIDGIWASATGNAATATALATARAINGVNFDGTANRAMVAPRLKTSDLKGRAIVIHSGGDNYSDEPAALGGGGSRAACGVVIYE